MLYHWGAILCSGRPALPATRLDPYTGPQAIFFVLHSTMKGTQGAGAEPTVNSFFDVRESNLAAKGAR
jgi:hypothetical protein